MNAPLALELVPAAPSPVVSLREIFGDLHCRPDITHWAYHADRSCVSASGLKQLLRSPAHFQTYLNQEHKETPALMLGTAIHSRLLEPELFMDTYVTTAISDKRSNEYRMFELNNADRQILSFDQFIAVEGIARSVEKHEMANHLLSIGAVEHTIIWQDEETGIWCKIRPDCLNADIDLGVCVDVKSTEDASEEAFIRSCIKYQYDLQAAFYLEGLRSAFGRDFDFCFLPVEKSAPYGCQLFAAPAEMLERGQRLVRKALRTLKRCRDTGEWPCYQPDGGFSLMRWPRNLN